jgi:hypothetical protein
LLLFLFGLKLFEINFILIPHSPPERFYLTLLWCFWDFWARCGNCPFAPPSLGDALNFCFCFLFGWKEFVISSILIPCISLEVLFWLCCGRFEILGLIVATVTFALPSLGSALVFCFCFLFLAWQMSCQCFILSLYNNQQVI